jgi:hypothetical protein
MCICTLTELINLLLLVDFNCVLMSLPTKGPLYPKLPPLESNDIQWDVDDDWRPQAISGVFGSETLPAMQKYSGVHLGSQAVRRGMQWVPTLDWWKCRLNGCAQTWHYTNVRHPAGGSVGPVCWTENKISVSYYDRVNVISYDIYRSNAGKSSNVQSSQATKKMTQ